MTSKEPPSPFVGERRLMFSPLPRVPGRGEVYFCPSPYGIL